jgi:hypothetical protein
MNFLLIDGLLSLLDYGALLQVDCDFGRVQQSVVDEAVMHGALDARAVLLGLAPAAFRFLCGSCPGGRGL